MLSTNIKFKLNLHKAYFEKGLGITNYFKYLIILAGVAEGLATKSVKLTFILAIIYGVGCYFLGWAWYRFGWYEQEIEVGNQFNIFVKETRKFINSRH